MAEYAALRELVDAVVRDEKVPDMTMRQMGVLVTVAEHEGKPLSVRPLAEKLGLPKPAVSRAVDRLIECGFVARKQHPMDRRQVEVTITQAGTAYLKALTKAIGKAA